MLGDMIRILREEHGLSQEQLADEIGVTRQSVSKWESGAGLPDVSNAVSLARRFGVSVDELLENADHSGSGDECQRCSNTIYAWPETRPDYSLRYMGVGSVFTTWREIDGMHCLREVGDEESYGSYRQPDWKLHRFSTIRAVRSAVIDETKGILIEHDVFLPNGFHVVRNYEYQAQFGDAIVAVPLALESPVGKRVQLFKTPAGEIRREPQQTWTIPWRKPSSEMVSNPDDLPLKSHSPEYQFPNLLAWDEHCISVEGEPLRAMGVAGLYEVSFGDVRHECTRLVICQLRSRENAWLCEYYINVNGRTVLKREFLPEDGLETPSLSEAKKAQALELGDLISLNGIDLVHVSDTICASALKGLQGAFL